MGRPDKDIAEVLNTRRRTIERVRCRFVTEGLAAALHPKPQPVRPGKIKIKGDVEQKLLELACSDPPEGCCHWTLQMLADELVVLGLLAQVSVETVRQALKKMTFTLLKSYHKLITTFYRTTKKWHHLIILINPCTAHGMMAHFTALFSRSRV
jgi:transposase